MSKNDKRELIKWAVDEDGFLEKLRQFEPQFTAEFGFHHERFLNQIKRMWNKCEFVPTDVLGGFFSCKEEYDCLLSMKEDFENRINTAIDAIEKLQNGVSDKTLATELDKIKCGLWQTGEDERWLEFFWHIERNTEKLKQENNEAYQAFHDELAENAKHLPEEKKPLLKRLLAALKCSK